MGHATQQDDARKQKVVWGIATWLLAGAAFALIGAVTRRTPGATWLVWPCAMLAIGCLAVAALLASRYGDVGIEHFDPDRLVGVEALPLDVSNKLKVYLSCLGTNSYDDAEPKIWRDISDHGDSCFSCQPYCDAMQVADRDFLFSDQPLHDDVKDGLCLRDVVLTGPKSEDVGFSGNEDFTLYWYSVSNTVMPDDKVVPVFSLYANTESNIAVSVALKQKGAQCFVVLEDTLDDLAAVNKREIALSGSFANSRLPCSFALVRAGGTLQVYFNDVAQGSAVPCGTARILLSNRNCAVNPTGAWDANVQVVALYGRALAQAEVAALTSYVTQRKVVLDSQYQSLLKETDDLRKKAKCPFADPTICDTVCKSITDWSNPADFMTNASVECRVAINNYCKTHPDEQFCLCWADAAKDTPSCKALRSFFDTSLTPALMAQQCDVRKLYPASKEPTLDKYYTAMNDLPGGPWQGKPDVLGGLVELPNDTVVNFADDQPLNPPIGLLTMPTRTPKPTTIISDNSITDFFGKGAAEPMSGSQLDLGALARTIKSDMERIVGIN
jgi:hypothetical protein